MAIYITGGEPWLVNILKIRTPQLDTSMENETCLHFSWISNDY